MALPRENSVSGKILQHALRWYLDHGADEALLHEPVNRKAAAYLAISGPDFQAVKTKPEPVAAPISKNFPAKSELYEQAAMRAAQASSLEALKAAIADFDGIALKKTATNLVFSAGNPQAPVMLIGEAPGADEDRAGVPFVGASGQLLDRVLASIGLDRNSTDLENAVYIANVLNWRPPGNRNPTLGEIELSLPFIERHIQLVAPKILVFCGGVSAKTLLGTEDNVTKLRQRWHAYRPLTRILQAAESAGPDIPALVTYHPSYLLRTPSQKKAVWHDMLSLNEKRRSLQSA
jgi:DNA polymerase